MEETKEKMSLWVNILKKHDLNEEVLQVFEDMCVQIGKQEMLINELKIKVQVYEDNPIQH